MVAVQLIKAFISGLHGRKMMLMGVWSLCGSWQGATLGIGWLGVEVQCDACAASALDVAVCVGRPCWASVVCALDGTCGASDAHLHWLHLGHLQRHLLGRHIGVVGNCWGNAMHLLDLRCMLPHVVGCRVGTWEANTLNLLLGRWLLHHLPHTMERNRS